LVEFLPWLPEGSLRMASSRMLIQFLKRKSFWNHKYNSLRYVGLIILRKIRELILTWLISVFEDKEKPKVLKTRTPYRIRLPLHEGMIRIVR
jgi:hypothetical protein